MAADAPDVRTLEVRGWLLRASEGLRAGGGTLAKDGGLGVENAKVKQVWHASARGCRMLA